MVGVVKSTVFDSGTSTLGSFTGGGVWTYGLGASGDGVQRCKVSATFSETFLVVSPAVKLVVVSEDGSVRIERILMADW